MALAAGMHIEDRMSNMESGWREAVELETRTIDSLISAVGPEVFASLKTDFVVDLRGQSVAYRGARSAGDDVLASESAHALRGAALNIGLYRLGGLAAELEGGERKDEDLLEEVLETSLARLMATG
tara:strand:- start:43960 stop:44337 length:378 start_codon:yes stop_codon:yes gene_type:complete